MSTNLLKRDVGMGVACVTSRFSLRKGVYIGHIQWCNMMKTLTSWANLYGAGVFQMGYTMFARDGKIFTDTACPT